MEIQLNDRYKLKTIDRHNWALCRLPEQKDGVNRKEDYYQPISFYACLKQGLVDILDSAEIMLSMETRQECMDWLEKIREIASEIKQK